MDGQIRPAGTASQSGRDHVTGIGRRMRTGGTAGSRGRVVAAVAPILLACVACADVPADTSSAAAEPEAAFTAPPAPPPVDSVVAALRVLPVEGLWPGFAPSTIPVLLFDGERTWLLDHPSPPSTFEPTDRPGAYVHAGRHPSVRGNMPSELDGVRVASVMLETMGGLSPERAAAAVVHERFHVLMLERHADWSVNELVRFQYPVSDVQQLFDRRMETRALERAMRAEDAEQLECWLRTALILRRKRMSELPPAVAEYERGLEVQEGLARYIERRAAGIRGVVDLAPHGYPPEEVRERAYVTGEALAVMLDRYAVGWKEAVEASRERPVLDSLLWVALLERPETSCGFSAEERREVLERATDAVSVMEAQRQSTLRAYEAQAGWRVRVISEGSPLWPQSFDPMSLARVGPATLLHERMLRAGNGRGSIDVFDHPSLSTGYLEDPLGSGIREVLVAGIQQRPVVTATEGDGVALAAPGVELRFDGARLAQDGQELVVRIR